MYASTLTAHYQSAQCGKWSRFFKFVKSSKLFLGLLDFISIIFFFIIITMTTQPTKGVTVSTYQHCAQLILGDSGLVVTESVLWSPGHEPESHCNHLCKSQGQASHSLLPSSKILLQMEVLCIRRAIPSYITDPSSHSQYSNTNATAVTSLHQRRLGLHWGGTYYRANWHSPTQYCTKSW